MGSVMIMGETERHGLGETERHSQSDRDFSGTWVPQTQETIAGRAERHGRMSSWILVAVVFAAFCVGGAAIIVRLWWLFWVCVGVVVLAVPAGKIVGIMDDSVLAPGTMNYQDLVRNLRFRVTPLRFLAVTPLRFPRRRHGVRPGRCPRQDRQPAAPPRRQTW